jgi:hypothetical protein
MIFISYSHADEAWRKRFETMAKPLSRAESLRFWSDRDLKAGEWEKQIEAAMRGAVAAVFLVSDNFLASDFIMGKEVPYLLRANSERGLMIFWLYLEPCDVRRYEQITKFQAMTVGALKPLAKMSQWEWKETMLRGCGMIDDYLKELELPVINPAAARGRYPRASEIPLLAKPARRRIEVLVYSPDKKWWRQAPVEPGKWTTKIHLGNEQTRPGTRFPVIAMTSEQPLTRQNYLSLPDCRTRSKEITLIRA